ncbi:MAG: hypothetical protein JNL67_06525 [Planctomycetaceae bacterium]|nr:hypothetical protein [Planctomycetaceae bacterium]
MRILLLIFVFPMTTLLALPLLIVQERPSQRPTEFSSIEVVGIQGTLLVFAPQAQAVLLSSSDLPNAITFSPGGSVVKNQEGNWEVVLPRAPAGTYRDPFSNVT